MKRKDVHSKNILLFKDEPLKVTVRFFLFISGITNAGMINELNT